MLTAGRLRYLSVKHTPFRVMRNRAAYVRRLDCGVDLFGGGFLLADDGLLAEAERAAAERAAVHVIELSDREKEIIKRLS